MMRISIKQPATSWPRAAVRFLFLCVFGTIMMDTIAAILIFLAYRVRPGWKIGSPDPKRTHYHRAAISAPVVLSLQFHVTIYLDVYRIHSSSRPTGIVKLIATLDLKSRSCQNKTRCPGGTIQSMDEAIGYCKLSQTPNQCAIHRGLNSGEMGALIGGEPTIGNSRHSPFNLSMLGFQIHLPKKITEFGDGRWWI